MKVGILGQGFLGWAGGIGFIVLVTQAIAAADPASEIHLFLPLGTANKNRLLKFIPDWMLPNKKASVQRVPEGLSHRLILDAFVGLKDLVSLHILDETPLALQKALRSTGVEAVLPAMDPLPSTLGVPWVGYLYDFQHRYLPAFFTAEEIERRNTAFQKMAMMASAVIVNSRKVRSDIEAFVPEATAKIFVMPFAPFLDPGLVFEDDVQSGQARPYFMVCNQFWIHKDHGTAIRAFAQIASQYPHVDLLCTGSLNDYRAPDYVPSLQDEIARLGLAKRVKLLGMVPKNQQMQLLKNSLGLIQPTLFEGGPGGGAVYDAVALGVPALVSDIEVNREVDCGDVRFFKAGDPGQLARLMVDLLLNLPLQRPDRLALLASGQARLAKCGEVLLESLAFVQKTRL